MYTANRRVQTGFGKQKTRVLGGWSANSKLCGRCRKITFTLTTPSLGLMPGDPRALEPPEWVTQELLDDAKRRYPNTRHWVPAYNMATEYYDHPLEVDPQTGKGFQATATYESASH
jgi:hypothetical protein